MVRQGCEHCLKAMKAIIVINRHLPEEKRIQIKDNFEFEEYGFKVHPIMDKLDPKTFTGYPYIYVDGYEIEPGPIDSMIVTLGTLLKEDLLFPINLNGYIVGG